jgi:hypothetical protein
MRHPTDGTLRRLVDEPAGVADPDREHVAGCPTCLAGLAEARQDAALTGAALRASTSPDVDAGWHRLSQGSVRPAKAVRHRRRVLRTPVVAGAAVAALLAGGSVAAAADWLPIFHAERIAAIPLADSDVVALPDLTAYGTVTVTQEADVSQVPDAAAARAASGIPVPAVASLPRGVSGDPQFQVGRRVTATFTFSAEKAVRAGGSAPPPGLDGSRFRLSAGPGVAEIWSKAGGGPPTLAVGRAVAPTAESSGVPFTTARDYLLSLPGLPAGVADQLRSFTGDGTTLPLPVPADLLKASSADVNGHPATVLTSRDGLLAGVVWVQDGFVTGVAGSLSADEVLAVARGLR